MSVHPIVKSRSPIQHGFIFHTPPLSHLNPPSMESRCIGGRGQIAVTMLCATRVTVRDSSVKNILPLSTRLYSERQVLLRIIYSGDCYWRSDGGGWRSRDRRCARCARPRRTFTGVEDVGLLYVRVNGHYIPADSNPPQNDFRTTLRLQTKLNFKIHHLVRMSDM